MIATELINASNTNDISFQYRMQNSILIPAEFIQQRSFIAGIGITNLLCYLQLAMIILRH